MLTEFILYLTEQLRQPYLWGGQHTRLTPLNYKAVIARKETTAENARRVEAYCEKMFAEGYSKLFAYDCSGLGVYWLTDLKRLWKSDVNANTMMGRCIDVGRTEPPEKGWWVFRLNGKKAVHIGYMIDDEYLIEAKGSRYGVVKTKWREKDWDCWGIPKVFEDEIRGNVPDPDPEPDPEIKHIVRVNKGKSVNVRTSDSKKGRILFTAHGVDEFPLIDIAPSGWYHIETKKGPGYITNLERYTTLI